MSESVKAFIEAAKADPELNEKLTRMTTEEIVAVAKEMGFELSVEDFAAPTSEMNEAELDNVAGGFGSGSCGCLLSGAGAVIDNSGGIFGCNCFTYGSGNTFCNCIMSGEGSVA